MVDDRQAMTLRFTEERYEWLREQAYRHRTPMQRIVDEAIDRLREQPAWRPRGHDEGNGDGDGNS